MRMNHPRSAGMGVSKIGASAIIFVTTLFAALNVDGATARTAAKQGLPTSQIEDVLQTVASDLSRKWNMSIAMAFYSESAALGFSAAQPGEAAAAAGYTDSGMGMGMPTRKAQPDDMYVWGSITKMYTGPAVLQLVSRGVMSLDDPISVHVDPLLLKVNGTTLEDKFGTAIKQVKVHHLLHMDSGVPDYDGEEYAKAQFAHRSRDFSPIDIIGHFVSPELKEPPGTQQGYCSTNYILLGLALANHLGNGSWQEYDQKSVIPTALQRLFERSLFVNHGTCESRTPVHGFIESYSTASIPRQDVWNVSCAGGWTAGNYVGAVSDVARYTYDLYNAANSRIVTKENLNRMLNFSKPGSSMSSFKFYGMGTFNLDWSIGAAVDIPDFPTPHQRGNYTAYGHVGDTYGYQSQTTYNPDHDFVITVATNIETSSQAQPAEATCLAYHNLVAMIRKEGPNRCNFTVPHRFIGICSCQRP
mmetsp:Transcript_26182/g.78678  ORF Transcript_26182/g.78678 Transcript_26182/m.78678 type:complete len:472 (+) Transcript_26182:176-1591(+)